MKIVGLVASKRKNGNSEILVKEALIQCREAGADVSLVRLTDLEILSCKGCIQCMLFKKDCVLNDDMQSFLDIIKEADGVILGFPVYAYNIPGVMKMVQDRVYMLAGESNYQTRPQGKKGIVLGAGSLDKEDAAMAFGELFLKFFLIDFEGSLFFTRSTGSGASFLNNKDKMPELKRIVQRLLAAIEEDTGKNALDGCPFCRRKIIKLLSRGNIVCPLCGRRGKLEDDDVSYTDEDNYFSIANNNLFYRDLVFKDYKDFYKNRNAVVEIVKKYQDKACDIPWIQFNKKINKEHLYDE